jgi:hypothetical protein
MNQEPDLESDTLRSEIDSTRGRMDNTIDQLEGRLHGRHLLDEIVGFFRRGDDDGQMGEWKQKISRSAGTVVDSVKAHPLPLILIGAGVGWLIYKNRSSSRERSDEFGDVDYTREDYLSGGYEGYGSASSGFEAGETSVEAGSESLGDKASSFASQAKDKLSQAREKVSDLTEASLEKLESAKDRATQLGQQAQQRGRELYGRTRERVVTTADQHPLELGIGFLALGVLAGMAMPTPETVSRRLNPAADKLRRASSDLMEKGKRVAYAATEAAKAEAKTQGLTLERVRDKAGAVAQKAGQAATNTAQQEGLTSGGNPDTGPSSARPSV